MFGKKFKDLEKGDLIWDIQPQNPFTKNCAEFDSLCVNEDGEYVARICYLGSNFYHTISIDDIESDTFQNKYGEIWTTILPDYYKEQNTGVGVYINHQNKKLYSVETESFQVKGYDENFLLISEFKPSGFWDKNRLLGKSGIMACQPTDFYNNHTRIF